jgi:hypothetical protein
MSFDDKNYSQANFMVFERSSRYMREINLPGAPFIFSLLSHYTSTCFGLASRPPLEGTRCIYIYICTVRSQKNGAVSKVNKKSTSHQVSHALSTVRFSCLLRGRGVRLQDGVAAGKGFLCALF